MTRNRESGLSLIEVLAATAIVIFILTAAYNVIDTSQRITVHQEETAEMDASARAAMEIMATEMRHAGQNPRGLAAAGLAPANAAWIAVPSATTVGEGLEIRMDLNGDGDTRDANEFVQYKWIQTGTTGVGTLQRIADRDSDGNDTIEAADGTQILARNVMKVSGETRIFRVLNKSGVEQTTAANIQAHGEAVVIQFAVRTANKDRVTKQYRLLNMREHVLLRNRSFYP